MIKHETFMKIAKNISEESKAIRRKVGALIVKENNIIAVGYNGTPSGFDNNCETKVIKAAELHSISVGANGVTTPNLNKVDFELVTKPEVLHAETNAIAKCAQSVNSSKDADLYTTTSPCFDCSKLIIQSGIKRVFYNEEYKDTSGLELLKKAGVKIEKIDL